MTAGGSLRTALAAGVLLPPLVVALAAAWQPGLETTLAVGLAAALVAFAAVRRAVRPLDSAIAAVRAGRTGDFYVALPAGAAREWRALAAALNDVGQAAASRDDQLVIALDDAARQRDVFYAIINAASDGLLLYDLDGRITASNERCAEMLGFSLTELLTEPADRLQRQAEARCARPESYRQRLDAHFTRPEERHEDQLELVRPRRRILRRSSCPLRVHGVLAGRVFTYSDITAEVELDRMKSEFVSIASHELRTPLTSLQGGLQLVLAAAGEALAPDDRELLDISLASTDRLVRLVNDLLDLSKIEARKMSFNIQPVDLRVLLDEAVKAMRGLAAERQISLSLDPVEELPPIPADRDHLMRVLTNLVSNALKYSPMDTAVTVSAAVRHGGVEVGVVDQGPGIAPDQVDRLFKPFCRAGAQERQISGGTGLGLAVSRAIIEQHGGRIWVEPGRTGGSRFAFLLPQAQRAPHASDRAA